jgi:hypothetical protein
VLLLDIRTAWVRRLFAKLQCEWALKIDPISEPVLLRGSRGLSIFLGCANEETGDKRLSPTAPRSEAMQPSTNGEMERAVAPSQGNVHLIESQLTSNLH